MLTPHLLAALSAAAFAWRDRRHRPIACYLAADVAVSLARPWLQALRPDVASRAAARVAGALPVAYEGIARWSVSAERALLWGLHGAAAWAVWRCLCPREMVCSPHEQTTDPAVPASTAFVPDADRRGMGRRDAPRSPSARRSDENGAEAEERRGVRIHTRAHLCAARATNRLRRHPIAAPIASLACATVIAWAAYPLLRTLPPYWPLASVALSLAAQLVAVTVAAQRRPLPRLSPPVMCAGIVVASTVAEVLAGPWAQLQPWRDWYLAAWCDGAALGGIAAVSALGWWQSGRGVI